MISMKADDNCRGLPMVAEALAIYSGHIFKWMGE